MKFVKKEHTISKIHNTACVVTEYPMNDCDINMAIAEIHGRYPDIGWVTNTACKEMGYVINGSGQLVTQTDSITLATGDMVLIEPGEKYYWQGEMTLLLSVTPAWYPEQHKQYEE